MMGGPWVGAIHMVGRAILRGGPCVETSTGGAVPLLGMLMGITDASQHLSLILGVS